MHRRHLWLAWALRDARRRWLQVLSIALLLALGTGMYSAMSSLSSWRRASTDASFSVLRTHDLRVTLAEGSYAPAGTLRRAVPPRAALAAQERLVVPTQVDASHAGHAIIVPGRLVGAPIAATVDRLAVVRGRALRAGDARAPVALLERNFAKHYELPSAGTVRLAGGRTVRYVGQAEAPEYFIVTAPGADFGAESAFAALFVPLETAQALAGRPGAVNELVVRARPGVAIGALQAELATALQRALPRTGVTFTRLADEPAHRLLYKDAEGDQQTLNVFAFLLLGAAAFAAFNLVSRSVEAQRREIGIGMALGVEPRTLAVRPFLLGAQIALLGVGLGIPAGITCDAWLRDVLRSFFPVPVLLTPFEPAIFLRGALIGLAIPLLATALPVWRAVRVPPIEAIRVGARAAGSSGLAWLARGIRVPGGSLANLPVRNVLRTPRRTVMTFLGIGAVVTIVASMGGVMDSFSATLDASRAEALAGARDRLTVDLVTEQRANSALPARIAASPTVGAAETSLRVPTTLSASGHRIHAWVELVAARPRLWRPTLRDGSLPASAPGVVIAESAARSLHVSVGDSIALRHPVATGPSSYALVSTRLPVAGIHRSPFRFVAYAGPATARALHVAGMVNRVSVTPARGRGPEDVKRALMPLAGVAAVQGAAATTDAVDQRMSQFTDFLLVIEAIAVLMALLIAFNASAINADERTREHATMFAYGVTVPRVLRGGVAEALIVGLCGTVVGIAAGYGVLRWEVRTLMPKTMPDVGTLISMAPATFAAALVAGTIAVAVAPLLTLRRLRRTDIPSALRVVE